MRTSSKGNRMYFPSHHTLHTHTLGSLSHNIIIIRKCTHHDRQDKYENEDLIKYGLPEDVWFHVDDLSSAHVYLRLRAGMTLDDISDDLLLDCASLVKANSIQGCKKSSVYVVYTRWKNLKKTGDMVDGQVGFHRPNNVRRIEVEKNGPIVRGKCVLQDNWLMLYSSHHVISCFIATVTCLSALSTHGSH